jgi:hypothetical protein
MITEDDRPKPLEDLPTIIGPLTTLYSVKSVEQPRSSAQDVLQSESD